MPFGFSPIRQFDTGRVTDFKIPFSEFIGNSFDQGVSDSMFHSIMSMREFDLANDGKLLSKEEATKKYGLPGLNFTEHIHENRARLLNRRHITAASRDFYTSQGNRDGLFSKRGLSGLGASMIGNILNPLDFAINFLPVVGSTRIASQLGSAGAGVFRQRLARGIITSESLAENIPFAPKFTESLIQGLVGNAIAEIPHSINMHQSQLDYTIGDAVVNILAGTALGGALHLGLTAAAKTFAKASNATREAMLRKGVNDFLSGRNIDVAHLVKIDENVIREKVKFDEQVKREEILQSLDIDEIKAAVKKEYKEEIRETAVRLPNGKILIGKVGDLHFMVPDIEKHTEGLDFDGIERGFMTDKGRFIPTEEAAVLIGKRAEPGVGLASEELHYIDPDFLSGVELAIFNDAKEQGGTDAHGVNAVRQARKELADTTFFSRPEIQQKIEKETLKRITEIFDKERASWDEEKFNREIKKELEKQIVEGKTLPPDQIKKWGFDTPEKIEQTLKEQTSEVERQIKELADELGTDADEVIKQDPQKIEDLLESLKIDLKGKTLEGVTGLPVILWNGAIDAVILAVKAGRAIKDAIQEGVKYLRSADVEFGKELVPNKLYAVAYHWFDQDDLGKRWDALPMLSANKSLHGKVFIGKPGEIHAQMDLPVEARKSINEEGIEHSPEKFELPYEKGFVNSKGDFVSRAQAEELVGQRPLFAENIVSRRKPMLVTPEQISEFESRIEATLKPKSESLFQYSIQTELAKEQPFNVKPDRFTPQVIMARLKNLPAPEQAMLKMAGIDKFLKKFEVGKSKEDIQAHRIHLERYWARETLYRDWVTENGRRSDAEVFHEAIEGNQTGADFPAPTEEQIAKKIEELKNNQDFRRQISSELNTFEGKFNKPITELDVVKAKEWWDTEPKDRSPELTEFFYQWNLPAWEELTRLAKGEGKLKTGLVDIDEFQEFVDSAMIEPEIKPMLNVAEHESTKFDGANLPVLQHAMETKGYRFDSEGNILSRPFKTQDVYDRYKVNASDVEAIRKFRNDNYNGLNPDTRDLMQQEIAFLSQVGKNKQKAEAEEGILVGEFVSQNVSVPIEFKKMEKPRTIFLAADQTAKVGSSHYGGVKFKGKKNMLAWMETHIVTMPDGRRVLHVFEAQSDVRQSFSVEDNRVQDDPNPGAYDNFEVSYLNEKGTPHTAPFATKPEADKFLAEKLREYQEKVQPLIDHTDEILMKAALKLAKKEGLDGVVISDPRTAMLTQGHLGEVIDNSEIRQSYEGQSLDTPDTYEPPSQAAGMTQAYGQKLPSILKKATGKEGEQVDLGGKHYDRDPDNRYADQEGYAEHFDKAFPGSDSPSGQFFPVKHLKDQPFETFTPKQVGDVTVIKEFKKLSDNISKGSQAAIDTAINCLLNLK